ncbi:RING finger protein PFF0165c [Babesia microti strain RI]|uniref:E3 ubiquitin protein ligase n=1 Tax=Babesia microti (strain RI) TaxID=1133968 RepID=I7IPI6_BABMR|nr:RING finger protein PFF0165c [Babesia microti strain RI]CCF72965.1 RING finger protein PFF0165c [Babesia microti strain RI]|eukprot:XP_012647574.1 RING finger protein PFF0165c [Babesia microti strain RI]
MDESGIYTDPKLLLENNARLGATLLAYRLEIDSVNAKYDKQVYLNMRLQFILSHLTLSLDKITNSLDDSIDCSIANIILDNLRQYLSSNSNKMMSEIDENITKQLKNALNNALSSFKRNNNNVINQNSHDFDYEALISESFNKYLSATYPSMGEVGELRNEISRLTKQNDILYRKSQANNIDNSPMDIETDTNDNAASSGYINKLTNQCKELDKALQKSQNQLLSFKMNVLDKLKNEDIHYEKLASMLNSEKVSHINQIQTLQSQLLQLGDENTKLTSEINVLKSECEKLKEICKISEDTLNDRIKLSESLKTKNTQLSKELSEVRSLLNKNTAEDDIDSIKLKLAVLEKNQAEFKTIEENLNNAINEIEEISIAFEEKQKQCENFTKQLMLKPTPQTETYNVKIELDRLNSNFQKQLNLYSEKIRDYDIATQLYIEGWNHSYQRAIAIERERDELLRYLHMSSERNTLLSRQLEDAKDKDNTIYGHRRKNLKPGDENALIVRENAELIKRITCAVCNERFRDHVIIKCGHFFCEPCLDDNIKSRNRRCSQCKINFDKRDIQKIYF